MLQADLAEALPDRPLRILDIGAGLGHMALWLAERGHQLTLAEPAAPMLDGARARFAEAGQTATFIQAPWQDLLGQLTERYDLVLCHAVLEWLAEPESILPVLHQFTAPAVGYRWPSTTATHWSIATCSRAISASCAATGWKVKSRA